MPARFSPVNYGGPPTGAREGEGARTAGGGGEGWSLLRGTLNGLAHGRDGSVVDSTGVLMQKERIRQLDRPPDEHLPRFADRAC